MLELFSKAAAEAVALGKVLWWVINHIFWYFMIGIFVGAAIRTFKIHVRMRKFLPKLRFWGVFAATGVGVISPLCACGSIPIVVSLMISGLPLAPAMAMVVSAPLMSPSGYAVTAGLLGGEWANAKLAAAVFMGLFAGLMTYLLTPRGYHSDQIFREEPPEGDIHDPDYEDERLACRCREQWSNRVAKRHPNRFIIFWAKAAELFWHVGKYTFVGLVVFALAERYVPREWIESAFGSTSWYNIPLITLASVPLHLNQFTAAGVLFGPVNVLERIGSDISWGSGMAFLIGGPVTALPVMGAFLSLFKPRVFWLYLALCISGTLLVATVAQLAVG